MAERRKMPQKRIAEALGLTWANVRWILYSYRKQFKPNEA